MSKIGVGVIGYGYWGPNLVRNFAESQRAEVAAVSDLRPERLALAQARYPRVAAFTDHREILRDPRIDAVAIATSVSSHYELALAALRAGKHTLVEKPITETVEQARELIDEAERRRRVLLVDHTFVYSGAVRKISELVRKNELGDIYYYDSVRVNLGLFQRDVSVIWDLAAHDLAIMEHVLPAAPVAVSATGEGHVKGNPENIAYVTLFFDSRLIAHAHVNWLAPVKVRRTLIAGSKQMIVYDDLEPDEKVKVYDRGVELNGDAENAYQARVGYRTGDMRSPKLDATEPLQFETQHFLDCIERGCRPITDGAAGMRIVGILRAATESMKQRGRPVELKKER